MSPISRSARAVAQAETKPPIVSSSNAETTLTPSNPQATYSVSSRSSIQTDSAKPPGVVPPEFFSPSLPPSALESVAPSLPNHSMASATKLGLAMIPVILVVVAIWVFWLFWWRKRKARKARGSQSVHLPLVPAKDFVSIVPYLKSSKRGSKVLNMSAFSTPISIHETQFPETQLLAQTRALGQMATESKSENGTNATITCPTGMMQAGSDSPIERTSPFRLKRVDTVKRVSLGSDISNLWLAPPPLAVAKRSNVL
ncbi:hypothetical protein EJ02DRAFT_111160 [Clathrospora elynae]|uniref:Uncharacterized protein n=1 Tax=Clathrospora elynae TaxID=706981 RepID=A0A6A5S8U9_9PLEO|nr:hypothetical protein EJ02DRAFT_111160 [Clathrospora elynae]